MLFASRDSFEIRLPSISVYLSVTTRMPSSFGHALQLVHSSLHDLNRRNLLVYDILTPAAKVTEKVLAVVETEYESFRMIFHQARMDVFSLGLHGTMANEV